MVDREWLGQDMVPQETRDHLFPTGSDLLLLPPPNNVTYYGPINNLTYLLSQSHHGIVPGDAHRHSQRRVPLISWASSGPIYTDPIKSTRLSVIAHLCLLHLPGVSEYSKSITPGNVREKTFKQTNTTTKTIHFTSPVLIIT